MVEADELLRSGKTDEIWKKYCGFLSLSLPQFMEIQEQLLLEQIRLIASSEIGRALMKNRVSNSVAEFRQSVPLTTYEAYADYLAEKREDALHEKPVSWCHTAGRSGSWKWVPYTQRGYEILGGTQIAALILALAARKGEVKIKEGMRVLCNTPPSPYFSGIAVAAGTSRFKFRMIPPLGDSERMEFQERVELGFKLAVRSGADILGSMTSVLLKVGEGFTDQSRSMKFSPAMLRPAIFYRLLRALLRSKIERRGMLPKDLWPVKAIMCGGADTAIYRQKLMHYWGKPPYEVYGSAEGGLMALQSWNKKGLTLVPYADFFEFIPEKEWLKSKGDKAYTPTTVLLDEVEEGQRYEVVLTNFYGMPFLRYRLGDLIKIISLRDEEAGIDLPQITFEARADDIIDLVALGSPGLNTWHWGRLDEKTLWQAIADTGISYEDWTMRKEHAAGRIILHLYIELKEEMDNEEIRRLVHSSLVNLNPFYGDLDRTLGIRPLKVSLLARGTFQRYLQEKQRGGADLAHFKPPHVNASDAAITDLLRCSRGG